MIISKTPVRVSFFGGGTDYPAWFKEHGGAVLATAINKYCYLSVRRLPPFFDYKHRIIYSSTELVDRIDQIKHPVVRAVLAELNWDDGIEVSHASDLPARSGLGTSSAFTVGLLNAIEAMEGRMASASDLARNATRIEQEVLRENVGCQDQITVATGGFNRIDFHQDGTSSVNPIIMKPENRALLEQSIMLFFTGVSRYASELAKKQIENIPQKQSQLGSMRQLVDEAILLLQDRELSISTFGNLMHESWQLKRSLADGVTSSVIDEIYAAGIAAGASGGKLLGAGGGGFILFIVEPELQDKVREKLKDLVYVNFGFDVSGSRIVVYEPNGLGRAETF